MFLSGAVRLSFLIHTIWQNHSRNYRTSYSCGTSCSGTCEDLLDPVAQNLVRTLILQRRNHAAHSCGVSPQKGSVRASSPGGGPASTYSPNTGPRLWGQTWGTKALWSGGVTSPKGLPALYFLPVGGIFYLHRIPHWYPTEACPVGCEKGARGTPADS